MLRSALLALLVLAELSIAQRVNADCPASTLNCVEQSFEAAAPVFQTECADRVSTFLDIPNGVIFQDIQSWPVPTQRVSDLMLRDHFTVSGPTPGTPIELRLRVHAVGHTHAQGGATQFAMLILTLELFPGMVGDGFPSRTWGSNDFEVTFDDSLDMVIHRNAGEPFGVLVHSQLAVGEACWGGAHLEFRFVDLPPGTTVRSCQGYNQEQPVGVESLSWGRVKAAYR